MRQAVLCGYYGMGNGGDEALLATLLQMLPKDIQPLVLSANPKATEKLHQVRASDRYSVFGLITEFRRSDLFIWGGGSLMQDATSARNPIYYGGLMGLAQGMGLQTIAWAQGVGPLHRGLSQWIAKRAFQGCQVVSVRDQNSAKMLAQWQVASITAPDPVWALEAKPVEIERDRDVPLVSVILRSHPELTSCRIAVLTEALQILQSQTNADILLIPFQPVQDLAIAKAIDQALNAKSHNSSQIITESDPRRLKGIFRNVDLAIAMRLHGVIMAIAEGCPCSALSYDPKVTYLMDELGLSGWQLQDLPDDAQAIAQVWQDDLNNRRPDFFSNIQKFQQQSLIHQTILS